MSACIFPGTFDPLTVGHVNIIRRAAARFERVVVAVGTNVRKQPVFSAEERAEMIRRAAADLPGVTAVVYDGLLAEFARREGICTLVKGIRTAADFEYELQMAGLNKMLWPELDTVFFPVEEGLSVVSSSAVREIASFGGDIAALVPECNLASVRARLCRPRGE